MGGPLQEVLQGRGDQKGKSLLIRRVFPLSLLVFAWLGLLSDSIFRIPETWYLVPSVVALLYCSVLHWLSGRREQSLEFLFSLALLYAWLIKLSHISWLKLAYFPFVVSVAAQYSLTVVVPLSVLIPFLDLKAFLSAKTFPNEAGFSLFLVLTAVVYSLILKRHRREKERAVSELRKIQENAREITRGTDMASLNSDEVFSHYFASVMKTDEEITELLETIRKAVSADSVNLLIEENNSFSLRCSTEEKGKVLITGRGALGETLRQKKTFYSGEMSDKGFEAGYVKKTRIESLMVIPVMDEEALVGLLTADSARFHAFDQLQREAVERFTRQLGRILERERIYFVIKQEFSVLKILKEESATLASSLDINRIGKALCEMGGKLDASQTFFFTPGGKGFELKHYTGVFPGERASYNFTGTLANFALENRHKHYVRDVREYSMPALPFKAENIRSFIAIPLMQDTGVRGGKGKMKGILCMLVIVSDKRDFLDSFKMWLLEIICNQATTTIENAKMHGEIERLATTDGLTGLFNHRVFQERLSEEISRSMRYGKPLSLLLADIDYFKKVNDTYGHPAGDLVLGGVAKIVRDEIREIDMAARYGGEEFAVILPETDADGARKIAERLRKSIMAASFAGDGKTLKVTASIGIATLPADGVNKAELIERADRALYHAKHRGRNQSVTWAEAG